MKKFCRRFFYWKKSKKIRFWRAKFRIKFQKKNGVIKNALVKEYGDNFRDSGRSGGVFYSDVTDKSQVGGGNRGY